MWAVEDAEVPRACSQCGCGRCRRYVCSMWFDQFPEWSIRPGPGSRNQCGLWKMPRSCLASCGVGVSRPCVSLPVWTWTMPRLCSAAICVGRRHCGADQLPEFGCVQALCLAARVDWDGAKVMLSTNFGVDQLPEVYASRPCALRPTWTRMMSK